jgi:hypothetical protein
MICFNDERLWWEWPLSRRCEGCAVSPDADPTVRERPDGLVLCDECDDEVRIEE